MEQRVPELERVKRLVRNMLNRTTDRGFTEAEAAEAGEKVGALLAQFDLELSDVLMGEAETCRTERLFADDEMVGTIVTGIARLCSLRCYHESATTPPTFVVFGFERDIQLALFLWEVTMEALATEWGLFVKENGYARKKRDSFRMGFSSRVHARLVTMRAERDQRNAERAKASGSTDLVLVRDAKVDEEFNRTGIRLVKSGRSRTVHDYGSYDAGHAAGSRVSLNTPVNGDVRSILT
jgi:hypothetical protein